MLKLIQQCEYSFGYNTVQPGYYYFSTLTFSSYKTHIEKPLVRISPVGLELKFSKINPGSISVSDITEKKVISWVE